jgi:poly(A) polymerase
MIDDDALLVLRKLNRAGFSSYLVGGGVRDLYIGKRPKDFDISTNARPGQVRKLFPNSRTIGRRFRLVQVFFRKGKVIEISTLRSLSEHDLDGPESVLAPNNTFGTLDEDAQRRDLTINGLFYEVESETIIDYVGGVEDLDHSIIRLIGEPDKRINRDPVRMMRVIRHSARSGFTIESRSWEALSVNSYKLKLCPTSRLRDELLKDIYSGASEQWFRLAVESGLFVELFALYEPILYAPLPNGDSCLENLSAIFATIDRLNNSAVQSGSHRQPAYFLLAMILTPWAISRFDLFKRNVKGPQLFQFSKKIREALNLEIAQQLNLKRSIRQEITTLLTYLPAIIMHNKDNTWPKWLRKKSYFEKCKLLYHCLQEALEKVPLPVSCQSIQQRSVSEQLSLHKKKRTSKNMARPAFSGVKRGGIFGLKK